VSERPIGAGAVEAKLAKKFAAPEYAFMTQVGNGTGVGTDRHADAVAMSLYPSRGIELHGFEIKVYRNDWLRELKQPEKADAIQRYCHFWWIVTARDVVTANDLIPATWGHMEIDGAGLAIKKRAPKQAPTPLTINMTAALFRAFALSVPQLQKQYVHIDDVKKTADELIEREIERRTRREELLKLYTDLQTRVADFEKASGIKIADGWNKPSEIGAIAKILVDRHASKTLRDRVQFEHRQLQRIVRELEEIDGAIGQLDERESLEVSA
jgi:hypothetical protein